MDRLDLVGGQDLERPERVDQPSPGQLLRARAPRDAAGDAADVGASGDGCAAARRDPRPDATPRIDRPAARVAAACVDVAASAAISHVRLRRAALNDDRSARPAPLGSAVARREASMKLKILAIVALGGRRRRGRVRGGRRTARQRRVDDPVPDRRRHDRRRHRRRRGDRAPSPRAPRTASRSGRRPTSPAPTRAAGSTTWTVTDLKVEVGDTVKKGAVLATADTTDLKRQLADANTAGRHRQDPAPPGQGQPDRRRGRRRHRADPPGEDRRQQRRDAARRRHARHATT